MYEYRKLKPKEREHLIDERARQRHPLHQPPHLQLDNVVYLLTAACYEHCGHVNTPERRDALRELLLDQFEQHRCDVHAWVVLPNHYHVLAEVSQFDDLAVIFRKIHGRTARNWNQQDDSVGRKVWYRYTDRVIRSERHYCTTLNYIHYNPVKHSLVGSPYDWKWSSAHWYLEQKGREWLRDLWRRFPVLDYGRSWDEI